MASVPLALSVDVDAPPAATWAAATDWAGQSAWMLLTTVETPGAREGVGAEAVAFTGITAGPVRLGVVDTMTVTRWEPPVRCDVLHTGRVVRGTGTFLVEPRDGGGSRLVWSEQVELPLGALGRAGWVLARPLVEWGFRLSLRRFARWVESGQATRAA